MERNFIAEIVSLVNSPLPFSDIHIEQDSPVLIKTPKGWSVIHDMDVPLIEDMEPLLQNLSPDWATELTHHAINRPYDLTNWRLRVNVFLACGGKKVVMSIRRNSLKPRSLAETGLPPSVRLIADCPRGILLVSGPTGAGKTTTLGALINEINLTRHAHIITIEDPIELIHHRINSHFSQREIGVDVGSYAEGVKDAMRQRPDVIVIGEIRDEATAETALLAAESGHLVMASIHANSAPRTIQKLLSFFPAETREARAESLSSTLVGVINQLLVPTADDSGLTVAAELLLNHNQQVSAILSNPEKLANAFARRDPSTIPMEVSLIDLVNRKVVTKADALRAIHFGQRSLYDRLKNI